MSEFLVQEVISLNFMLDRNNSAATSFADIYHKIV